MKAIYLLPFVLIFNSLSGQDVSTVSSTTEISTTVSQSLELLVKERNSPLSEYQVELKNLKDFQMLFAQRYKSEYSQYFRNFETSKIIVSNMNDVINGIKAQKNIHSEDFPKIGTT